MMKWWKRLMSRKPKLSVELTQDTLDLYQTMASSRNQSLSAWVRETLSDSIPTDLRGRIARGELSQAALNEAFARLDKMENPLRLAAPAKLPKPTTRPPLSTLSGHPCRHLSTVLPANYRANECQGTCQNPRRGGACFWAPLAARDGCEVFSPKVVPRA